LRVEDLPLLHRWLNTDFVNEWWERRPYSYEEIVEKYTPRVAGHNPTRSFIAMDRDLPIGYIQSYLIRDYPDYSQSLQVEDGAAGVDLFIGEAAYIHRGLGAPLLRRFLCQIVFTAADVTSCVIGPDVSNKAAIRAYEKAGFRYLKTVQVPGESAPEYLMRIEPQDLQCS